MEDGGDIGSTMVLLYIQVQLYIFADFSGTETNVVQKVWIINCHQGCFYGEY